VLLLYVLNFFAYILLFTF